MFIVCFCVLHTARIQSINKGCGVILSLKISRWTEKTEGSG